MTYLSHHPRLSSILAILLGVFGGLFAAAILDWLSNPQCPVCKSKVRDCASSCPSCHVTLRWS